MSALLAIFVVAFTVPCFTLIMACIGLFTLSILCFVLPPVFYLRLRWQQAVEGKADDDGWWYAAYAWAFLGTGAALALTAATVFTALFPLVMPSSIADVYSLTTTNAAALYSPASSAS